MSQSDSDSSPQPQPRWQPLSAVERRVAGALVEKAKTTPDAYPLSLNALVTACNQKNNRYPVMELEADAVEDALGRLRAAGAVALVQGGSRVDRYRHLLYDWLGVDKVELAVMAELLLRGAQTEGELRGRAARMDPIADLAALRPLLDSLRSKGLIISLTREGRGHVLTHALYQPRELERLQAEYSAQSASTAAAAAAIDEPTPRPAAPPRPTSNAPAPVPSGEAARLRSELEEIRQQVSELQAAVDACRRELGELRDALGA